MIHVVAIITTKPGRRDAVLAEFNSMRPDTLAEAGCIEYQPVIDADGFDGIAAAAGPDVFVVIEKWESADHLKAHSVAPHMKAYAARVKDMLADRKIHVFANA